MEENTKLEQFIEEVKTLHEEGHITDDVMDYLYSLYETLSK